MGVGVNVATGTGVGGGGGVGVGGSRQKASCPESLAHRIRPPPIMPPKIPPRIKAMPNKDKTRQPRGRPGCNPSIKVRGVLDCIEGIRIP